MDDIEDMKVERVTPEANHPEARPPFGLTVAESEPTTSGAGDLEAVFDVPVKVQAVLGRAQMDVSELIKMTPGAVIELDRRVGEAVDIYVNDRLVARGEVVLIDELLGVTMTEIVKDERA